MKIKHRVPTQAYFKPEPIDQAYQDQIDRSMAKLASREHDALKRLQAAERRLSRLSAKPHTDFDLAVARELVELRRQELLEVQRTMQSVPASSAHRSRAGKRPIPGMGTL